MPSTGERRAGVRMSASYRIQCVIREAPCCIRYRKTLLRASAGKCMPERNSDSNRKSGLAYGAALTLFMCVAAMTGVGSAVDRWLGTRPAFLVGGIILGSIAGFYQFIRITSRL